jgi:hypothetical protein
MSTNTQEVILFGIKVFDKFYNARYYSNVKSNFILKTFMVIRTASFYQDDTLANRPQTNLGS